MVFADSYHLTDATNLNRKGWACDRWSLPLQDSKIEVYESTERVYPGTWRVDKVLYKDECTVGYIKIFDVDYSHSPGWDWDECDGDGEEDEEGRRDDRCDLWTFKYKWLSNLEVCEEVAGG